MTRFATENGYLVCEAHAARWNTDTFPMTDRELVEEFGEAPDCADCLSEAGADECDACIAIMNAGQVVTLAKHATHR